MSIAVTLRREGGAEFWRCVPLGHGARIRADCRMTAEALRRFVGRVETAGHHLRFLDDEEKAKEQQASGRAGGIGEDEEGA